MASRLGMACARMLIELVNLGAAKSSFKVGTAWFCVVCGVCGLGGSTSGGGSGACRRLRDWASDVFLLMGIKWPTCTSLFSTGACGGEIIHKIIAKLANTANKAIAKETNQRAINSIPSRPPRPHQQHRPCALDPLPAPPNPCAHLDPLAPRQCLQVVLGVAVQHGRARYAHP